MDPGSLFDIGFALRTHGVKGQLRITFNENIRVLSEGEALFFLLKDKHIPYFIADIEYLDNGDAFVLLEEVNTKEQAVQLAKNQIFGPMDYIEEDDLEEESEHPLIGFFVLDKNVGDIGKILGITPMAYYVLAHVDYKGKEILLAIHDDLILKMDKQNQTLLINAPEGILDL